MPPYWGVRGIYWLENQSGWGLALEYTHSKAYAKLNGTFRLDIVQPEGKAPMRAKAWAQGARIEPGERLGEDGDG